MKEKILQKFGEVFGDTTGVKTYLCPRACEHDRGAYGL